MARDFQRAWGQETYRPMKRLPIFAILLFSLAAAASAQESTCPCIPTTQEWIADSCDTWECAMSALVTAKGDPYTIIVPNGANGRWVVLRRVVAGTYVVLPNAPYACETFDGVATAGARYSAVDAERLPMLLTSPDGKMLVISLTDAGMAAGIGRRRSVNRP